MHLDVDENQPSSSRKWNAHADGVFRQGTERGSDGRRWSQPELAARKIGGTRMDWKHGCQSCSKAHGRIPAARIAGFRGVRAGVQGVEPRNVTR